MASLGAFASTVRSLFKALRYAGLVFVALAAWFLGKEVFDIYRACAAVHVWLGIGFLAVFGVLFYLAIVRPAQRYLRVPASRRRSACSPLPWRSRHAGRCSRSRPIICARLGKNSRSSR